MSRRKKRPGGQRRPRAQVSGWHLPPCENCGRTLLQGHEYTCPAFRRVDEVVADDARWFRERPGAKKRVRPADWSELAEQRSVGCRVDHLVDPYVIVYQLTPGVRSRAIFSRAGDTANGILFDGEGPLPEAFGGGDPR